MRSFYQSAFKKLNFFKRAAFILTLVFITILGSVNAQSVTVNTTIDENNGNTTSIAALISTPGGAGISIREAVLAANNEPSGSTVNITIPAGNYSITIAGVDNTGQLGDIDVLVAAVAGNKTVNIIGAGAATTIITGLAGERIFEVHANSVAGSSIAFSITGVTLTGGSPATSSGGAILAGRPGDVTTVTNCIFSNNVSTNAGGALSVSSGSASHNLTVTGCSFTNNTSNGSGAAISFNGNGTSTITIDQNTFTNNTSSASSGGAINISGTAPGPNLCKITRNTFTANTANVGGAAINAVNVVTINANYNRIVGNNSTAVGGKMILGTGGVITTFNKDNNWWGVNTGPAAAEISDVTGTPAANWLQLKSSASPVTACVGGTSTVTSGFLSNSAGSAVSVANLTPEMIGLPVTFSAILGTLSAAQQIGRAHV